MYSLSDATELITVIFGYHSTCLRCIGGDCSMGGWSRRCILHVPEEVLNEWVTKDDSGTRRGLRLDKIIKRLALRADLFIAVDLNFFFCICKLSFGV